MAPGRGAGQDPAPIARVSEEVAYANPFGTLYDDVVAAPDGTRGRHVRWRAASPGVVVVPVRAGAVALCAIYRYPIAAVSLEFPRGGIEEGETAEAAALRELREETGLTGVDAVRVGELHPETGLIDGTTAVVVARVGDDREPPERDALESVGARPRWESLDALDALLRDGTVRCGVTIAAAALYRASLRR